MTNKKKIEIYEYVIHKLTEDINQGKYLFGMCFYLYSYITKKCEYEYHEFLFPEVIKHKPKNLTTFYWFDLNKEGNLKRIEILKDAIKEVKQKIKLESKR